MPAEKKYSSEREARVVHPYFFRFYDRFLKSLKSYMPGIPRWNVIDSTFKDGSPWIQVVPEKGTEADLTKLPKTTFVPFWFIPGDPSSELSIRQIGNALTHTEPGRSVPLSNRVIGICPFANLRQDKDTVKKSQRFIGEAMSAEMFAQAIKSYFTDVIFLDPHSSESIGYFETPHLSLTSVPLFVEYFKRRYPPEKRKQIKLVALDKGALQRCLRFAQLAGLDIKNQIVVLNKERVGQNQLGESSFLYGDPNGSDIIIFDDIIDTSDSMKKTCESLKKAGCGKITLMAVHGTLSEKAPINIRSMLDEEVVDDLVITDSLPYSSYKLEGVKKLHIIKVAPMMAGFARLISAFSIPYIHQHLDDDNETSFSFSGLAPFIMEPQNKEEVWQDFQRMTTSQKD